MDHALRRSPPRPGHGPDLTTRPRPYNQEPQWKSRADRQFPHTLTATRQPARFYPAAINASVDRGLGAFLIFFLGYRYYSPYLAKKVFGLDPNFVTPAHEFQDGVDFVPTNRHIVFSHHFISVAGAAPIVGPAIAVIWGWGPALAWVVLGTVFAAGVHDFGAIVVSVRHKAKSVGTLASDVINKRARALFLCIIFLLLTMVNAVFAIVIAGLFVTTPAAVLPVLVEIPLAIAVGQIVYKKRTAALMPSLIALVLVYAFIPIGLRFPIELDGVAEAMGISATTLWIILLFIYGFIASRIPVWMLLQPRDYINLHQMSLAFVVMILGIFIGWEMIAAPLINDADTGAPPWFPLLFVTIACGAISGFHSLVSSGTTSKQLDKETDARMVGYLGASGEGLLATCSILACTAGVTTWALMDDGGAFTGMGRSEAWSEIYSNWGAYVPVDNFVNGVGAFASNLAIPLDVGIVFAAVVVISFAATTMDTGVRLQRYVVQEIAEIVRIKPLARNLTLATTVATLVPLGLALMPGNFANTLWQLFGTTNQLTAGLALSVIAVWVTKKNRNPIAILIPLVFLLVLTTWALIYNLINFARSEEAINRYFLAPLDGIIFLLAIWLIVEAFIALRGAYRDRKIDAVDGSRRHVPTDVD